MELPFTTKQFFDLFEIYNLAILPAQLFAYLFASIAVFCIIRRTRYSNQLISLVLAAFWFWNGAVYHLIFLRQINKAAYLFGVMFILQGLLFCWYGNIRRRLVIGVFYELQSMAGCMLLLYSMFVYTALAIMNGHYWPRSATFGVTPCPTTTFTFGVLLWASEKVPWQLLVIPTLWSLIGSSAVYLLGVKEDLGLLIAALIGVPLILTDRHCAISPK